MKEDFRVCPKCRKVPPQGQVWADFYAHVRACGKPAPSPQPEPEVTKDTWERLFGKSDTPSDLYERLFGGRDK